jgi:hypothetical protein
MIIGIVGFISSGKGTVGDILANEYGFIKDSFAKPLKDAVSTIFNWPRHLLEGDTKESREWRELKDEFWSNKLGKTITPRLVLQWMGTEAGRNVFGENLWSASLINRSDPNRNYVITDVRFVNEIKSIQQHGGKIIRVIRGQEPNWMEGAIRIKETEKRHGEYPFNYLDEINNTLPHIHRSEWDWVESEMDVVIRNDSSLEDLKIEINHAIFTELRFILV